MDASLPEIKKELLHYNKEALIDICLRLGRYKKENKELMAYLIFEAIDPDGFVAKIKLQIQEDFESINTSSAFFVRKSLRKILRRISKYVRFIANKETEADLLIYFCEQLLAMDYPVNKHRQLTNIYSAQLKKITAAISSLHPDIQYDLQKKLFQLEKINDDKPSHSWWPVRKSGKK